MATGIEQITKMLSAPGVKQQQLHASVIRADFKAKQGFTSITFGTTCCDAADAIEAKKMVGIILWIPREEFDKEVKP